MGDLVQREDREINLKLTIIPSPRNVCVVAGGLWRHTATHAYAHAGRRSYRGGRGRRGDRGEAKEIEREPKRLRETV